MLTVKVKAGEWLVVGASRVKMSRDCSVYIDAPREIQVCRGDLVAKRLQREVHEIVEGDNQAASHLEREAVAYLCQKFNLHKESSVLGDYKFDFRTYSNPHVKAVKERLKIGA